MQVNVTVSINGPNGEELSVVIGPDSASLTLTGPTTVSLDHLRQFVAALDKVVRDES